jgi:hypothetical protein
MVSPTFTFSQRSGCCIFTSTVLPPEPLMMAIFFSMSTASTVPLRVTVRATTPSGFFPSSERSVATASVGPGSGLVGSVSFTSTASASWYCTMTSSPTFTWARFRACLPTTNECSLPSAVVSTTCRVGTSIDFTLAVTVLVSFLL